MSTCTHSPVDGRVQEGAAVRQREFLAEVESALHARVSGAPSPGGADGSEAHVVRDVACEDAVGDQPSRPVPEICPVPLQGRRGAGIHGAAGLGGVVAVGNVDNRGRGGATRSPGIWNCSERRQFQYYPNKRRQFYI